MPSRIGGPLEEYFAIIKVVENNKIVIVILALVVAGTALVGFLPKSPNLPASNGANTTIQSPTFSKNFNLPSLLSLRIWPTATPGNLPATQPPIPFTSTPKPINSTVPNATPTNTNVHNPPPTGGPQPTSPPVNMPTPMTLAGIRPGSSLQEIARIAEGVSCTPAAFILAVKTQETGQRFFTTSTPTIFRFYNTYGWWKPPYATAGDSCYGYSYNTITGLIAPDAVGAGTRCANAIGNPSAASQAIMGMMQLNQSEQNGATAKFQQFFPGSTPDRRVLFDAMVLGGIHYKKLSTKPSGCDLNWDIRDVAIVSCRFYGACTDNYCENVCRYYDQYGGPTFNCGNIANLVAGSATGCVLK